MERFSTIFKRVTVHSEVVLTWIKMEIIARIGILKVSRKAHRCRELI